MPANFGLNFIFLEQFKKRINRLGLIFVFCMDLMMTFFLKNTMYVIIKKSYLRRYLQYYFIRSLTIIFTTNYVGRTNYSLST